MPSVTQSPSPFEIVDFHSHFVGPSFAPTTLASAPPAQRPFWEGVNRRLTDPEALLDSIETDGVAARVISAPLEFLREPDGTLAPDVLLRVNIAIAEIVRLEPGRLYGLATVDAYSGEAGARELLRAVEELGLSGVFIESAKGELLPDAPEARPTFAAAAALGVPILLHPVPDAQLGRRFKPYGRLGGRLMRGTINAAALVAILESGMLDEMPDLSIVATSLAMGGVLLAGGFGDAARFGKDAPNRRHLYIDITGLHPATVRAAVDVLGADHVLTGTDWPVVTEASLPARLQSVLGAAGLDDGEQRMVAGANARRLLDA